MKIPSTNNNNIDTPITTLPTANNINTITPNNNSNIRLFTNYRVNSTDNNPQNRNS